MITIFNGRERTLGGLASSVHVQVSIDFRDHLHTLKGASLAVFLSIALHSNEDGWSWPSRNRIARETGYNTSTISQALAHLCSSRIKDHRILLRYQPQGGDGNFKSNRYLIFPSPTEVAQFDHRQPTLDLPGVDLPCTVQPCTEKPYTVKPYTVQPYTENLLTNQNHSEREPSRDEEETTDSLQQETSSTTPAVDADDNKRSQLLSLLGIMEPTRSEILALDHATGSYLQSWLDWYQDQDNVGPGLIVNNIRQGITAPLPKPKHRLHSTPAERQLHDYYANHHDQLKRLGRIPDLDRLGIKY